MVRCENKVISNHTSKESLFSITLENFLSSQTLPTHSSTSLISHPQPTKMSTTLPLQVVSALAFFTALQMISPISGAAVQVTTCRSYCGNITVDYPFAVRPGCGHPGFRELLFCMNGVLMLHITSGSYRVLDIDYAYQAITLDDPHMSNCDSIVLGGRGNGFEIEHWRAPYLNPAADNVFMLLGCSAESPLFQGFPSKHLPCRNVSGMGCEEYYGCSAWGVFGPKKLGSGSGRGPPECCGVAFEAIRAINLTKLECEGYSSAYSLAPLREEGPGGWSYGIRVRYSVQGSDFCRSCEATGGACGYGTDGVRELCLCGKSNSTSNCDSVGSSSSKVVGSLANALTGILGYMIVITWKRKMSET